ncbi:uncharacterized protein N7473_004280 [Penicillium subrubescens]|uniref:uncharacterized protein n=1 Tax=Penicillium subrubescens TaxID=1316194 RepID=UPI0025454C83|nr:uncharacterized protein N7473_004280 [Penicillium subrubescens]KAJ5900210.1 hypothetical protein N7473_004280 [Penicillium subrubescens]
MSASLLSPLLFEDSDSNPTQSTTSAASEINRILYNLPSRERSNSETSVYQDCINIYESADIDSDENNEENISSLGSQAFTQLCQTGIEIDGVKVSGSSRDTVIANEIQEHLILPEYPDTDKDGVLHIIHASKNPLQNLEDTTAHVNQITSQLISSVQFSTKHLKSAKQIFTKLLQKDTKDKESRS